MKKEKSNMEFRKRVSLLGVITGSIVAVLGRQMGSSFVGAFIGIQLEPSGTAAPANLGYTNPSLVFIALLVTALFSILGGYTAATIARHNEMLNGALSSFLAILLAVCSIFTDPLYLAMLTLISSPLFAALGGYLRLKQKARKTSPNQEHP
jgi:hypothetical protein